MLNYIYSRYINSHKIINNLGNNYKSYNFDNEVSIAISTNNKFLEQAQVLIQSFENISAPIKLYILNINLTNLEIKKLKRYERTGLEIQVINIDDKRLDNLKISTKWPLEAWARVLIPELIRDEYVLYLDVDCLIVNDLTEIFKGDFYIAGVKSPFYKRKKVNNKFLDKAINSGVVLMNTKKLKNFDFTNKVFKFAHENKESLIMPDQDAINYVCRDIMSNINPKYNVMNFFFYHTYNKIVRNYGSGLYDRDEFNNSKKYPIIIHYNGGFLKRPWDNRAIRHPLTSIYKYYHKKIK